jgi:hypothetical protein
MSDEVSDLALLKKQFLKKKDKKCEGCADRERGSRRYLSLWPVDFRVTSVDLHRRFGFIS